MCLGQEQLYFCEWIQIYLGDTHNCLNPGLRVTQTHHHFYGFLCLHKTHTHPVAPARMQLHPQHPARNTCLVPAGTQGGKNIFFFYIFFFSKTYRNLNFRQKMCHNRKSNTVQRRRGVEAVVRFELPESGNSPKVCLRNQEQIAPFKNPKVLKKSKKKNKEIKNVTASCCDSVWASVRQFFPRCQRPRYVIPTVMCFVDNLSFFQIPKLPTLSFPPAVLCVAAERFSTPLAAFQLPHYRLACHIV